MKGNTMKTIKAGDIVKIKKEWQDKGDELFNFVAIEDQSIMSDRITIRAEIGLSINPTYVVKLEMLETL
jgi:hypothetical protein